MTTLFVSDVHLDARYPKVTAAFTRWLTGPAAAADTVFILGDLFEAWIGDDDDETYKLDRLSEIRALSDSGVKTYFMHGNRDFLAGPQFAEIAGLELLQDPFLADVDGETWLLSHGDAWCTDDVEYMQFRTQVRDPQWQQAVLQRPLQERRLLAGQMRDASQSAGAEKSAEIMDVNADEIRRAFAEHGTDTLLHGHTHRPACHRLTLKPGASATRWVLGDWYKAVSYLEISAGVATLHSLPLETRWPAVEA